MIIPWHVDVPQDRWPVVNWLLIAGIIGAFVLQVMAVMNADPDADFLEALGGYVLTGLSIKGLFGHMWLHGGIIHLLGNLLFLWIFGNAVCAKIGNLAYLPLYIFFGVLAGIMHLVFQGGPMIGASGAIMGVVGMFLVFFPQNEITCYFFILLYPKPYEFSLSSYWMILFWLGFDIWGAMMGPGSGVAYFAHLGGFAAGFGMAVLLLKTKLVEMNLRYEGSIFDIYSEWRNPKPVDAAYNPSYEMLTRQMPEVVKEAIPKKSAGSVGVDIGIPRQKSVERRMVQKPVAGNSAVDQVMRFINVFAAR